MYYLCSHKICKFKVFSSLHKLYLYYRVMYYLDKPHFVSETYRLCIISFILNHSL